VWGHGRGGSLLPERAIQAFFSHVSASYLLLAGTSHSTPSFTRPLSSTSSGGGDGGSGAGGDDEGGGEEVKAHVCLRWGDHLPEALLSPHCNYLFDRKVKACSRVCVHTHEQVHVSVPMSVPVPVLVPIPVPMPVPVPVPVSVPVSVSVSVPVLVEV